MNCSPRQSSHMIHECCTGTRVDGFLGSSQRLRRRYKMDHLCFSTPWLPQTKQIRIHDVLNGQTAFRTVFRTEVIENEALTWVWSFLWSSEKRAASASRLCFNTLKNTHTHTRVKNTQHAADITEETTHYCTKPAVCYLNTLFNIVLMWF